MASGSGAKCGTSVEGREKKQRGHVIKRELLNARKYLPRCLDPRRRQLGPIEEL